MSRPSSPSTKRPGADAAALALRLTVGPMLVMHGSNKILGEGGLGGTGKYFETLGLKPGSLHATLAAGTEIGSGGLMTVGALSPLPAAGMIGLMTVAARTAHKGKGFLVFKGGWEYTGVIAGVAAASAALGPGPLSVGRKRGKERQGLAWAIVAVAIGIGAALGLLRQVETQPDVSSDSATA